MNRYSLTLRITLLMCVLVVVLINLRSWIFFRQVEHYFNVVDEQMLLNEKEHMRAALRSVSSERELRDYLNSFNSEESRSILLNRLIVDETNQVISTDDKGLLPPDPETIDVLSSTLSAWQGRDGRRYVGYRTVMATGMAIHPRLTVYLALNQDMHSEFFEVSQRMRWIVTLVGLLPMFLAIWLAVRLGLKPLRDINTKVRLVTVDNLGMRIDLARVPAELATLSQTLNQMLERLQAAFKRLNDFSVDLAHELRTPLSGISTQIQVLLARSRPVEEYQHALELSLTEINKLARMTEDMLYLARTDNQLTPKRLEAVRLDELAQGLIAFYDVLAEERGLQLECHGHAVVQGDRSMLRRALGNLLSNAIRYAQANTSVKVDISDLGANGAQLAVSNLGSTIAPEHLARLFQRFYRGGASMDTSSVTTEASEYGVSEWPPELLMGNSARATAPAPQGVGLGLAITRAIVHAHGGEVSATSVDGCTTLTIQLPKHAAPHPRPHPSTSHSV